MKILVKITAYNRGYGARQCGATREANPYHPAAACLWSSWRAGWNDARRG